MNVYRHAFARKVAVDLQPKDGNLVLEVRDDGVGMDPAAAACGGVGLRIMQYRAGLIGAALLVGPAAGGGTLVTCTLHEDGKHDRVGDAYGAAGRTGADRR